MVILGFCLLCPSVCPHELRHFILEKTELFLSLPERKGRREEEEEEQKKGKERNTERERERMK